MVEVGKSYFYIGVGIEKWKNKLIKVVSQLNECMGTNKDIPVYSCELDGEIYKVLETNISESPIIYGYRYGGMGDTFPESVERFPTFKNGEYILEYTWGNY